MSEFGLIERIARLFADVDHKGWEAIGDDCTVLPIGGGEALAITTDMLVEGVHFLRDKSTAADVGYKALAVNLSDVAAMGLSPVAVLLSIALPEDAVGDWADEFVAGFHSLAAERSVALVGGDTTLSKSGVVVNVVAIGRGPMQCVKRRSAAQVGDIIYVSGSLGGSAIGLKQMLAGEDSTVYTEMHRRPKAQTDVGLWLGGREEVHAMMDLSDGLASDLCHILAASDCGAEVAVEQIPAEQGDIESAVCGGEDYQLLFTVAAGEVARFEQDYESRFGCVPYSVGRINDLPKGKIVWIQDGQVIEPEWQGFTHF